MLVEVRARSQITIPAELVKKFGISEGDKFDITERDGGIFLCPVAVYPKDQFTKLAEFIKCAEKETENQPAFENVDAMLTDMGIEVDDV